MYSYFTAHDNLKIRCGRWTAAAAGGGRPLVLLNGRAEFMEKYGETVDELTARGFAVYSMDWRGQGLSDRMLSDRHRGYVGSYADYLSDLGRLMDKVAAESGQEAPVLLGHSMGGHIGLRYIYERPGAFRKLVLVSPMIDIRTFPLPAPAARLMTVLAAGAGRLTDYAPGAARLSVFNRTFSGNRITSDRKRFEREQAQLEKNPDLALGGVTYGWLRATFDAISLMRSPSFAAAIDRPVCMVCAGADRIVSSSAQERICRQLPDCRRVVIPGARHEILMERDAIRNRFWRVFDEFVGDD